ncbi:RtcB family protein [Sporichthya sp.]|uniref:RtcB family protein n=1 Tax=Sporichthya sp. TaxID=65475 RepID=UPI0017B158C0|nr:RtcB family protein [Sporichthya sp.]MBA3744197.1 RtcB family protein [Sporichthya sp.]
MTPVVLPGSRVDVRMWADPATVEDVAMAQLRNVANLPWVHGLAVMPDVHYGKGATVGSVIAMRDAVSPAAVGVDIGCGMTAVRTSLTAAGLPDDLAALRRRIEDAVPVGFNSHKRPVPTSRIPGVGGWDQFWSGFGDLIGSVQQLRERALHQMGSLGGGNHFIEVCTDAQDQVWLMLHSGSRNIGKELAERHIANARNLPHNADLPDKDLAVFLTGTPQMDAYRRDLYWAQDYAKRNRATMLALLCQVVRESVSKVQFDEPISCHHNYVAEESYDGIDVLVTRKGAIRAGAGDLGLIPGSMGVGSYVVRGLGNPDAFNSASHGAGRKMSRNKARKTFTTEDLAAQTAGIECRKDAGVVDEIPGAYKDLDEVMSRQTDLVEVVAKLTPLICVKG